MAITYRDITLKNTEKLDKKQDKRNAFRAVITDNLGNQSGSGSIWADQNARRIWVMPIGGVQPFQIICVKITPVIGLGVICGYSDDFSTLLEVLRTDYEFLGPSNTTGTAYESPSNLDFLPGGRLQLWIDGRMIQPLATYPDTTGLLVNVVNGEYIYGGVRVTFDGEEGIDLTSSVPGTANQHRYVGLYLDSTNTIQTVDGTAVSTANTAPEPTWPAGAFELSMVLLANGQTDIDMTDIANKRIFSTDITSFAAGGWPFAQVLTVSTTDLDADFDNLPDAITAASAGDTILLDSETFTITGSALSISKALTIAGQSQAQTIITSALSNSPSIDVTADNVTFKNLTVAHTGAGTTAGPLSTDNANLVLDNVYLDKTSGAATTSYGLWMYGGSVTLKNGTRISTTAGTNKYGIYNDTADTTITIFGGQIGGDTQDIYGSQSGSTLTIAGVTTLTNSLISWAGIILYSTTLRAKLLAARTYYVDGSTGSDSNNGLTSGTAFATVQKAVDIVSGTLDLGNYDVTVNIANGTYTDPLELKNLVTGSGTVILDGDTGTPSNVHISLTGNCITGNHITGVYTVQGLKLTASGGGIALLNQAGGLLRYGNIEFAAAGYHLFAQNNAKFYSFADYSITGGANAHIHLQTGGQHFQQAAVTITLTGTPAFASNFIYTGYLSQGWFSVATFSGSATGKRYTVEANGIIYSGGGASFFPGNSAGSTATGGLYL